MKRLLLRLFPKRFRDTYGSELLELHRDLRLGRWAFVWDVLKNAVVLRVQERKRLGPRPKKRSPFMDNLWHDLRCGARGLLRRPGFSLLALTTLTLGIGASTAIFTVVNWVVLRPLPYPSPDEIVRVWWRPGTFNHRVLAFFEEQARSFEGLSAFSGWSFTLTGDGEPEEVEGFQVSIDHFSVVGVEPALGRGFLPEESEPGRSEVVILSHGLWVRRFGADEGVLGRRIELSGGGRDSYRVVGVMPASYRPIDPGGRRQVWVPLERPADLENDDSWFLLAVGRLKSHVTPERATAEVARLARRVKEEMYPRTGEDEIAEARVERLEDVIVDPRVRAELWMLFGAVGIVLLVTCGNVANLLLARTSTREREMAVRTALGADRGRVTRQLLTETLLLGITGGALGALLAVAFVSVLASLVPAELPRSSGLTVDARVLGFALLASIVSSLAFGSVPALEAAGKAFPERLRVREIGHQGWNRLFIAGEVAFSLMLVLAAGLMLQSFWNLTRVDPGFDPERVLVIGVVPPDARYPERAQKLAFYRELFPRLEALPGVEAVGSIHLLPLGRGNWDFPYYPEGHVIGENETPPAANFRVVSPGYFRSMGIPFLKGRAFTGADRNDGAPVGIINEAMANRTWPGEDPVGKEITVFGPNGPSFTVVGVVSDVRQHGLAVDPRPEMYRPLEQWTVGRNLMTLRTESAPESVASSARQVVWSVDPDVPIVRLSSMEAIVAGSIAVPRFATLLLSLFAGLALFLAGVGVYGVTSYIVSERTHEIGLRMALGANGPRVRRDAIRQGMMPVLAGIAAGLLGAIVSTRLMTSLLFEVRATDPITFTAVSTFLGLVALAACYLPARRASRVDPMVALRFE